MRYHDFATLVSPKIGAFGLPISGPTRKRGTGTPAKKRSAPRTARAKRSSAHTTKRAKKTKKTSSRRR
jgi:hypothetical protein